MNERIRKLAEQSYEATTVTTIDPFTSEVVVDFIDGTKPFFSKEKFAELIVAEACQALNPMLRDQISRGHAADLIKKHFGFEE